MMNLKKINDNYSVSGQITVDDVPTIKAAGFRSIICNRPDNEADDQPLQRDIEDKAAELGMTYCFLPIVSGQPVADADVQAFKQAFDDLPKPVLAYCRTGTRCTTVWSFANAVDMNTEQILAIAEAAGYDMSPHVDRLNNGGKLDNN